MAYDDTDPYNQIGSAITMSENPTGPANQPTGNGMSTAAGNAQMIDGTWGHLLRTYHPELYAGKSDAQLKPLKGDSNLSLEMAGNYARENGTYLDSKQLPVNPGTLFAAHQLGPGGAEAVIRADPNSPMGTVVPDAVRTNPSFGAMTAGQYLQSRNTMILNQMNHTQQVSQKANDIFNGPSQSDIDAKANSIFGAKPVVPPTTPPVATPGQPAPATTPPPVTTLRDPVAVKADQIFGAPTPPPGTGGAGAFDAQGNPRVNVAPPSTVVPNTNGTTPLSDRVDAIINATKSGYNQPFLTPEGQALADKYIPQGVQTGLSYAATPLNVARGVGAGVGEGLYQGGEAIHPGLGPDAVALGTVLGVGAGVGRAIGVPGTMGMGLTGNKATPIIANGRMANGAIPGQRLTPALYPSTTPEMVADEAAARTLAPKSAKIADAHIDQTNLGQVHDTLTNNLTPAVTNRLFNVASVNDPNLFSKSLLDPTGKAIDPLKYNSWLDNLQNEFNTGGKTGTLTRADMNQLEEVRRVANANQAVKDVQAGTHPTIKPTDPATLGTGPVDRFLGTKPGPWNPMSAIPLAGLGIGGEGAFLHAMPDYGLGSLVGAAALSKGLNVARSGIAAMRGPAVEAANQQGKINLLKNTFDTPTTYKPGGTIIAQPNMTPAP